MSKFNVVDGTDAGSNSGAEGITVVAVAIGPGGGGTFEGIEVVLAVGGKLKILLRSASAERERRRDS